VSTVELVRRVGALAVAVLLLGAMAVLVLRLVALPLAGTAMALDAAANGLGRALQTPAHVTPAGGAP